VLRPRTKGPVPERALRRPRGAPLVPACNWAGTKGLAFSPAYVVPVCKPGLKALTDRTKGPVSTSECIVLGHHPPRPLQGDQEIERCTQLNENKGPTTMTCYHNQATSITREGQK
jgi:hypothetical protein